MTYRQKRYCVQVKSVGQDMRRDPALAIHEFKGCCQMSKNNEYVRTKTHVISKIREEVKGKKAGEIYNSNVDPLDPLEGPSSRRQIYNIKARIQTEDSVENKANFSDQVSALEELQQRMPFVKLIVRQHGKVPLRVRLCSPPPMLLTGY